LPRDQRADKEMNAVITSADKDLILADQVKELYGNSFTTNLSLLAISPLLAWILWPVSTQVPILLWYFYTVGVIALRLMFAMRYKRSGGAAKAPQYWLKLHICGVVLSGLGWGDLLVLVAPLGSTYYILSTTLVVCGLVTASAATQASLRHGFAAFAIPALLPGALYLILRQDPDSLLIGIGILVFLLVISVVALRIHRAVLYSIRQQFEHSKMIVELEQKNQEAEARSRALENQLGRVTKRVARLRTLLEHRIQDKRASTRDEYLLARADRLQSLLEKLNGGIWDCNLKTGEVKFSPAWLEILGYSSDEVQPTMEFWQSLLHPDERHDVLGRLYRHVDGHAPVYSSSHRLRNKAGEWIWVMSRGQSVAWGTYGEVLNLSSIEIVIADANDDLSSKLNLINFDIRDWFCTSTQFNEHLQQVMQTVAVEGVEHALCHLKIFREGPDEYLSPALEESLLEQVGRILLKECRHRDAIVSYGSKGFGLLMEYCTLPNAWAKAQALQAIFKAHQFTRSGANQRVGVCIGITPILDVNKTAVEVLSDAEKACELARGKAPGYLFLYQQGSGELNRALAERQMLQQIQMTLGNKSLRVSALPTVAADGVYGKDSLFFMETALAGTERSIMPLDFRAVADANNLSAQIDQCAMELFHTWAQAQPRNYADTRRIYIMDCAGSSISDAGFIGFLKHLSINRGQVNHLVCFGIAESLLLANHETAMHFISTLHPLGYRFALTGVGTSPFAYEELQDQPFDYLVLDTALTDRAAVDKASLVKVKYISEISHIMNRKTIAANVNSAQQMEMLKEAKIDYAQGSVVPKVREAIA